VLVTPTSPSVHERGDTDSSCHVDGRDNSNTQNSNNDSGDTNDQTILTM